MRLYEEHCGGVLQAINPSGRFNRRQTKASAKMVNDAGINNVLISGSHCSTHLLNVFRIPL